PSGSTSRRDFFISKVPAVIMGILTFQSHGNAQGLVHTAHIIGRDAPGPLPQAAFVQGADLLGEHNAVLGKSAPVRPHAEMGAQAVYLLTPGDGRRHHGGAVPVPDHILNDKYRPDAPLLRANPRAQIGLKHFLSVYFHGKDLLSSYT